MKVIFTYNNLFSIQVDVDGTVMAPKKRFQSEAEAQFSVVRYSRELLNQAIQQFKLPTILTSSRPEGRGFTAH